MRLYGMPNPKDIRFLGIINQFGKFSPKLSDLSRPLRDLLSSKITWLWGPAHDQAFLSLKKERKNLSVLMHYDLAAETMIATRLVLGQYYFRE